MIEMNTINITRSHISNYTGFMSDIVGRVCFSLFLEMGDSTLLPQCKNNYLNT